MDEKEVTSEEFKNFVDRMLEKLGGEGVIIVGKIGGMACVSTIEWEAFRLRDTSVVGQTMWDVLHRAEGGY